MTDVASAVGIDDATALCRDGLRALGYPAPDADAIAAHLIDCELRGLGYGGLARLLSIAERVRTRPAPTPPRVVAEGPAHATIDGGDTVGYLVAARALDLVVDKAAAVGSATVAARRTWYTGMLSYYAEQATRRGLVVMLASNATPWVAPHGGAAGRYGTNPVCFGFPSADGADVIWDIGTSSATHAEIVLARRRGRELAPGLAVDASGHPTTDPDRALAGAITAWGGARGSGLGLVVQLLGMMAGSPASPGELEDFGLVVTAWSPGLFGDPAAFAEAVAGYGDRVRATPATGPDAVRMPFDRSRRARAQALARGTIDVDPAVLDGVRRLGDREG